MNTGASVTCFICNLPIQNHQVGLIWQGSNGVDDFLREQMEMDIIRGRLGNDVGRRNSCAQITTIESADDLSSASQTTSKRRRSSLAQLSELFKDWGISHPGNKSNKNQQSQNAAETQRRGTLADLGRTFGCKNKRQLTSTASVVQPPTVEPDFMSKIRKRRETSADITVLRKGSGTTTDLKSDISRFLSQHRVSASATTRNSSSSGGCEATTTNVLPTTESLETCGTASNSSGGNYDDLISRPNSRRGSVDTSTSTEKTTSMTLKPTSSSGPLRLFKRKESRGNISPMSPDSESAVPSFACVVRLPSTSISPIDRSASPSDVESEQQPPRRDSLKPIVPPPAVSMEPHHSNSSPTNSRRGLRRQANYEEQQPLKSGWCSNPNLWAGNHNSQSEQLTTSRTVAKSATSTNIARRWTSIQSGNSSRRGSRPFLSPDERPDIERDGSGSSLGGRSTRSGRRDSLSPDSANEDGSWRMQRRDSRPLLSSEPDGSREQSPGSGRGTGRRGLRRRSSGDSSGFRKKPSPNDSVSSAQSSREHSPKAANNQMRRQSTTEEILIARGFRRESTTEDILRCRNFRRQSVQYEPIVPRRGRRDSCTQITDGTVSSMVIESDKAICDAFVQTAENANGDGLPRKKETPSLYENNHYHEECLKCNSCGMNLSGANQKRARRFKNQILCDLHFADMALMESSDFMQQLRNFKPQSLGCAVARRKSSTTLIFPLPPQACSDEFCDGYPHNLIPTPGYWIECSRAISNQGSAWTNEERDLQEVDEGITDSPDGSLRDAAVATDFDPIDANLPRIREPKKKKTPVEEKWDKYGSFGLTSVEQETHEKYFYGTEHWNYFTNDEDLGPVILSLKQENINGRDQFRVLVRAVSYTIHGLIPASSVFADRYNREEVVASLGCEINLNPPLTLGQLPDTSEELLKLDQVFIKSELKVGVIYVKENQYTEEDILDNNEASPLFEEFLQILGETVKLKGFDRYKGGLDTVHDLTGFQSVFTQWRGIEVMFHVSTLLPHEDNDPQKLQRKRHIGNDIVCVVFLEADNTSFSPSCIKSHFLHTFIIVRASPRIKFKHPRYEVSVVTRDEVGAYKPYLWEQSVFTKGPMFREWILTKIVNGERASYSAPKFARMQERTRSQMLEDLVANLQNHAETGQIPKPYRRGSWRPIGHMRPSSPLLDSVRDLFEGQDQLAKDFTRAFQYPTIGWSAKMTLSSIFDVTFMVGTGKNKTKLSGVRAILGVRSRVFQEMLYGISTGFGSPQVPVAEILARAAPSPPTAPKPKSSNFLQVPDIEGPRPKSVPNSPSIPRAFSNLRHQLTSAWGGSSKSKKGGHHGGPQQGVAGEHQALKTSLSTDDKKKWSSSQDCASRKREHSTRTVGTGDSGWGSQHRNSGKQTEMSSDNPVADVSDPNNPGMSRLSMCADAQKVDKTKLAQTEFPIIEFDGETFAILLTYLHTGSCHLSCLKIPGLICAAEHYDLPELLQACFHHAKQFIRIDKACQMLGALENYYWRYSSASELVNMILAFVETRAQSIFETTHFLELSESMVQLIINRNLEAPEVSKFEAMLKWAKHRVQNKTYNDKHDAKIEFRCCMDRLTRDLKLYRISPQDLIKVVIPSKAIKNEKIMQTLMVQADSGMYRVQDHYFEACRQGLQKQDSRVSSDWDSLDATL